MLGGIGSCRSKKVLALLAVLAVLAGLVIVPTGILADSASLSFSPTMQPLPTGTNRVGWYGQNVTVADETVNGETVAGVMGYDRSALAPDDPLPHVLEQIGTYGQL